MLRWLLLFVPITIGLEFLMPESHTLIFAASCLAILPLAGWLGDATEQLAHHTGEGIGGLLNATFGNAAELIIAIMALREGLYSVVKASLTGSIIGNILLVLGAAAVAGGTRYKTQRFNATAARSQATLMTLASIALIVPAGYHYLAGPAGRAREEGLSVEISIVLLATYAAHLLFSLRTHKHHFQGEAAEGGGEPVPGEAGGRGKESRSGGRWGEAEGGKRNHQPWSLKSSVLILAGATALIAWMSEILVGSVQAAADSIGMTRVFVGVIVVAVVGNAAEHSTAVMVAMKNKMELSLGIAIGSSLQIALFVAPVLVILSHWIGPRPMDLVFSPAEVLAVFVAVMITGQIASDGETNWLEGVQLLAVYLILALTFYFLPDVEPAMPK